MSSTSAARSLRDAARGESKSGPVKNLARRFFTPTWNSRAVAQRRHPDAERCSAYATLTLDSIRGRAGIRTPFRRRPDLQKMQETFLAARVLRDRFGVVDAAVGAAFSLMDAGSGARGRR